MLAARWSGSSPTGHYVRPPTLVRLVNEAGRLLLRYTGLPLAYHALLRRPARRLGSQRR